MNPAPRLWSNPHDRHFTMHCKALDPTVCDSSPGCLTCVLPRFCGAACTGRLFSKHESRVGCIPSPPSFTAFATRLFRLRAKSSVARRHQCVILQLDVINIASRRVASRLSKKTLYRLMVNAHLTAVVSSLYPPARNCHARRKEHG